MNIEDVKKWWGYPNRQGNFSGTIAGKIDWLISEHNRLTAENAQLREQLAAHRPEAADSCAASSYKCEALVELEEDRNNWLGAAQEMTVLMREGSKSIAQLSAHPVVAKLCMVLRCKEKAEQERDDLKDCIAIISKERDEARKERDGELVVTALCRPCGKFGDRTGMLYVHLPAQDIGKRFTVVLRALPLEVE